MRDQTLGFWFSFHGHQSLIIMIDERMLTDRLWMTCSMVSDGHGEKNELELGHSAISFPEIQTAFSGLRSPSSQDASTTPTSHSPPSPQQQRQKVRLRLRIYSNLFSFDIRHLYSRITCLVQFALSIDLYQCFSFPLSYGSHLAMILKTSDRKYVHWSRAIEG